MRGGGAFTEYSVESLSLPETIKTIDDEALKGCSSLKHVQISPRNEGFSSFDDMIFTKDYSHLLLIPEGKEGAVTIPGSTTHVSAQALSLCHLGSSLITGDGSTAFASHDRMLFSKDLKTLVACPPAYGTAVVLPIETETIGEYAFAGCKDLASITALGNIQSIDPTAFADEVKASAVVALPAGEDYDARKSVWENAGFQHFAEPAQPGSTTNPDNNDAASGLTYTLLDDYTLAVSWQDRNDPEANLEVPASAEINGVPYRVSTIAENAFANSGSLTSVKLPTTITTINNAAFAGCANLSTIEFPNTLRQIGERAFEATSLKDAWLPASINFIDSRAFAFCSSLERVVALGAPDVTSDALAGCTNVSIYVPSGSEDSWNPGLPSDNNHLMPYGVSLSKDPLTIEAGQEADLLEDGDLQVPDPVEVSYSYAAAPLSVDAGTVSAKKEGTSDVTIVLSLDGIELTRATRTVEVSPNPDDEEDVALLNSKTPLPSTYLANLREASAPISVDAPFAVTFGDNAPYDVANPAPFIEADALFKNNSNISVQLAQVDCGNLAVGSFLLPKGSVSLDKQELFSLYPEDNTGAAVNFGYGAGINAVTPSNPNAFGMTPHSSGTFTFRLNLSDAKVIEANADNGNTAFPLVSVVCKFGRYADSGQGLDTDNFYLKDIESNQVYSLEQVKAHANDIAKNKEASLYWSQYQGYISNDSSYTCKTNWGGITYDVLVIGINHDDKADGGKAGLTFQFKNTVAGFYAINGSTKENPIAGNSGWGQSELRARMNPDDLPNVDGIVNGTDDNAMVVQVPGNILSTVEVVKKYYAAGDDNFSTVRTSNDKFFVPSLVEVRGTGTTWDATYPWVTKEGTQYEYYAYRNVGAGLSAYVIKDNIWWERTRHPEKPYWYFCVDTKGDPLGIQGHTSGDYVSPCFCL